MSNEALNAFMKKVNTEESLRTAFEERFGDTGSIPADDLIGFANERGYDFTVEEVKEELSESELEGVSGGILSYDYTFPYVYDLSYDFQTDTFKFNKA